MGKVNSNLKIELDEILELAKQGDFSKLDSLNNYIKNDNPEVRIKAAYVIQLIGYDGAIIDLGNMAIHDNVSVNRNQAVWALVGIGKPAVINILIEALHDKDIERREDARAALYTLLGDKIRDLLADEEGGEESSIDDYDQLKKYWDSNAEKYNTKSVYSYGMKCTPGVYIQQLKSADAELPDAILDSLHFWTGQNFGQSPLKNIIKKWENWWKDSKGNYKEGHRYFYGFEVPSTIR